MNYLSMALLKKLKTSLPVITLLIPTIILRLRYLGYSNYQGDEIKALFLPKPGESIADFLLSQRKGPVQFFITFCLKLISPGYTNEWLIRLPFALAGILAIYFFFKLLKLHFGTKLAFYASLLLSLNGFLIAFSRIAQYQSFVICFMILALYVFSLAVMDPKWQIRGIYWGFVFWAISILSHYDGVFIAPFVGYLFLIWLRHNSLKKLVLPVIIFVTLLAVFYIPFVFAITDGTLDYWQNRISGGAGKISSSAYLFRVYHPIYTLHIYTILAVLGSISAFANFIKSLAFTAAAFKFIGVVKSRLPEFLAHFVPQVKLFKDQQLLYIAVGLWVGIPFVFMEFLVNIPGTHIYTYLIPLSIILALGLVVLEKLGRKLILFRFGRIVSTVGVITLFTFLFLQSYAVFVDHTKEYPWENEPFLVWEFHKPTPIFHLSMFGFPYYRNWEGISAFIASQEGATHYSTNERTSISRYFIPLAKDTDQAGYFIYINNPQSFTDEILQDKVIYWSHKNNPVYTYSKNGEDMVRIYLMPQGSLEQIQLAGY